MSGWSHLSWHHLALFDSCGFTYGECLGYIWFRPVQFIGGSFNDGGFAFLSGLSVNCYEE